MSVSRGEPCWFYHPAIAPGTRLLPVLGSVWLTQLCLTPYQTLVPSSNKQKADTMRRYPRYPVLHPRVPALHSLPIQHPVCWDFTVICAVSMWDTPWAWSALVTQGPGGFSECSHKPDRLLQQLCSPSPVLRRCRGEPGVLFLPSLIGAVITQREQGNSFLHMLGSVTCRSL